MKMMRKEEIKQAEKITKALAFVEHIEEHLKNDVQFSKHDKVMCKICGKTIDEIYEEAVKLVKSD